MKPEQAFNAALSRFKSADADVARASVKLEESKAKRVDVAIPVAAAESEAEKVASSGDIDTNSAAKIVSARQTAEGVLDLLDRGIEHLETELATAKIDAFAAERECAIAQAAFHDAALDEQTHKWLRSNAKQLQSLVQQMHLAYIFASVRSDGAKDAYPPSHVETFFTSIVPRLVSNEFTDDQIFRAGCQAQLTGSTINKVHVSLHLSDGDRSAISACGSNRNEQVSALRRRMQPERETEHHFNRYDIEGMLITQKNRANALRQRIDELERIIAKANEKSSQTISLPLKLAHEQQKSQLAEVRAELGRVELTCSRLQEKLQGRAA